MKILITGSSGLIGTFILNLLSQDHDCIPTDLSNPKSPIDITQFDQVSSHFAQYRPDVVLHLAAYTDVTKAWEQANDVSGLCYRLNVTATESIAQLSAEYGAHLIHMSTAYIFDGENPTPYTESHTPNPIEWYGKTKALAEEAIQSTADLQWTILRIDKPFSIAEPSRPDFLLSKIVGLTDGSLYPQFVDHFSGPTIIEELAELVAWLVTQPQSGILHASTGEQWSDYAFAEAVAEIFQTKTQPKHGSLLEYLKKSNRPYQKNTALSTAKLSQLYPKKTLSVREALVLAAKSRV